MHWPSSLTRSFPTLLCVWNLWIPEGRKGLKLLEDVLADMLLGDVLLIDMLADMPLQLLNVYKILLNSATRHRPWKAHGIVNSMSTVILLTLLMLCILSSWQIRELFKGFHGIQGILRALLLSIRKRWAQYPIRPYEIEMKTVINVISEHSFWIQSQSIVLVWVYRPWTLWPPGLSSRLWYRLLAFAA